MIKPGQLGLQSSSSDWDTGLNVRWVTFFASVLKDGLKQTPEHTADRKANCVHHLARDSGRAGCAGGSEPRGFSGPWDSYLGNGGANLTMGCLWIDREASLWQDQQGLVPHPTPVTFCLPTEAL